MKIKRGVGLLVFLAVAFPAMSALVIEQVGFTKTTYRADMNEDGNVDAGGTAFLFVRNNGTAPETITNLFVNGASATNYPSFRWWRAWPETIPAGGVAAVTSHGTNTPWAENVTTEFVVLAASGQAATNAATLQTPKLRVGDLVPSRDARTVNLYLRNLDTVAWTVTEVWLNDDVTSRCTFVGGATVQSNGVLIVKVAFDSPPSTNTNYCVRVRATNLLSSIQVAAAARLIEPLFHLGTWQSTMLDKDERVDWARRRPQLNVATGVNGDGFVQRIPQVNSAYQRFGLRGVHQINRGSPSKPDAAVLADQQNNPAVMGWYLRDEPDLSSSTSGTMAAYDMIVRRNDANHPVTITLAANRKFNEFGNLVDIPCMDHYGLFAPYVNTFRNHTMDEPLIYSEVLKQNTEPLRMWNWCQTASGGWSSPPPDWANNIQFWSHVMAGAKVILFFTSTIDQDRNFPAQVQAIVNATMQLNHIRTRCLYSETIPNVATFPLRVEARSLIGEDAMVLVVANMNADEIGPTLGPWVLTDLPAASATVRVPSWIPIEQIVEVRTNGAAPATYTNEGRTYTFNFSLHDTRVFLIGRADTNPPSAVDGLNVAWWMPATNTMTTNGVLAWRDADDDFGVSGYKVYRDGTEIADVRTPIYTVTNLPPDGARYFVRAYMAGNLGAPSATVGFADPNGHPTLRIARQTNGVEVAWSEFFPQFHLQANVDLATSNWFNVPSPTNRAVIASPTGAQYFRLVAP